ncbi:MAG: DMT family transporter [Gammaproteobacteria bacterium]|nr:DMT family transporter [Gammaproteobacteria bacterium]
MGYIFSIIAIALWAFNFIIAVIANSHISAIELSFYRWLVAFIILLPWIVKLAPKKKLIISNSKYIILPAIFGVAIFNTALYLAANYNSSFNLSLIAISAPIVVIAINRFVFNIVYSRALWFGVLVATIGVMVLISRGDINALTKMNFSIGDLLMFVAATSWGIYTATLEHKQPREFTQIEFLALITTIGLLILIPVFYWQVKSYGFSQYSSDNMAMILYLGIFPSVISFYSWNKSIEKIGATKTGATYYFIPVFVFIYSSIFLDEKITYTEMLSFLLIFSGLLTINFTRSNQPTSAH